MPNDRLTVVRNHGRITPPGGAAVAAVIKESGIRPIAGPQSDSLKVRLADEAINEKWNALGGAPGAPKIAGAAGLIKSGSGYSREYTKGRIYYRPDQPCFNVYGAIGDRYTQLEGPAGWLGWPTSDEQDFPESGRVSTFEHGAIYWWEETGAIELNQIAVRYTGLVCFGETDNDQDLAGIVPGSADEPYVIFGVLPVPPGEPVSSATHVYENVDAGESVRDDIELYRGHPYGASLSVVLMEHDFGDPDKFRAVVKTAVDEASKGITVAVGAIPAVGPFLALAAGGLLTEYGPKIVDAVNTGLDTQDDHVGSVSFQVTAKNMVTMARAALKDTKGVPYHLQSPLITGLGASYKVYVRIQAA